MSVDKLIGRLLQSLTETTPDEGEQERSVTRNLGRDLELCFKLASVYS